MFPSDLPAFTCASAIGNLWKTLGIDILKHLLSVVDNGVVGNENIPLLNSLRIISLFSKRVFMF